MSFFASHALARVVLSLSLDKWSDAVRRKTCSLYIERDLAQNCDFASRQTLFQAVYRFECGERQEIEAPLQ